MESLCLLLGGHTVGTACHNWWVCVDILGYLYAPPTSPRGEKSLSSFLSSLLPSSRKSPFCSTPLRVNALQLLSNRTRLSGSSGFASVAGRCAASSADKRTAAEMVFSSSALGGRGSPARRLSASGSNAGGYSSGGPRDRVSRFFFFSILLVAYSGVTLGLILWNNSGGTASNASDPNPVEGGGGGGGRGTSVQVLRGGSPDRYPKGAGEPAAWEDGGARVAASTRGMPGPSGSDGGGLEGGGSGATQDALSTADDTETVGQGAGKIGARGGDGLALEQLRGQVREYLTNFHLVVSCINTHHRRVRQKKSRSSYTLR